MILHQTCPDSGIVSAGRRLEAEEAKGGGNNLEDDYLSVLLVYGGGGGTGLRT